ncbi:MAG: hypothetical protein ABIQ49_06095 [Gemmatimonadales bacterium]
MSPRLRAGPVRPLFRALAWVLGPLLIAGGALLIFLDLRGVNAHGWPTWSQRMHTALWLGIGNLALGWMILRAGRTGEDPVALSDAAPAPDGEPTHERRQPWSPE